jgi:sulfonate transport system permease protein
VAFNSLPRIALVPLITMIFGFGLLAKIVLAWSIVFFIVFFNTFQGARSVDADLIHSARFLGASERQIMTSVIVPSTLAWTFASLTRRSRSPSSPWWWGSSSAASPGAGSAT